MKQARKRQIAFFSIAIGICCLFQGCESAESYAAETGVEPSEGGNGGDGGDNGGEVPDDGSEPVDGYLDLSIAPASSTLRPTGGSNTSQINFVNLSVSSPISGYTYRWTLSSTSLGELSQATGTNVRYTAFPSSYPASGSETQTITVTGTSSGSSIRYRGTATVTHQAP